MHKLKGIFYVFILVAASAVFALRNQILDYFSPQVQKLENAALNAAVSEIKKQFSAPPPLRLVATKPPTSSSLSAPQGTVPQAPLTASGTISWTNVERANNNLPLLSRNETLDEIAALRAKDMFAKQYFAHISSTGEGAESVAKEIGYDYLALGENLALGNFKNDADLVRGWMNSPGHRANILNSRYTEIGVAVKKGICEGDSVWIAVQIFGRPASACPRVDQSLKTQIETYKVQFNNLQAQLAAKKQEIKNTQSKEEYNQKTDEYNALVVQYNALLQQNKASITNYNSEVSAHNQCIAS